MLTDAIMSVIDFDSYALPPSTVPYMGTFCWRIFHLFYSALNYVSRLISVLLLTEVKVTETEAETKH